MMPSNSLDIEKNLTSAGQFHFSFSLQRSLSDVKECAYEQARQTYDPREWCYEQHNHQQ